jgi:hypothetical protein
VEFLKQLFVGFLLPLTLIIGVPFLAVITYRSLRKNILKSKANEIQNNPNMSQHTKWKGRGMRWLVGYLLFWIVAGGVAGIIARSSSPEIQGAASSSFVKLFVIGFLIWCAVKDRGNKRALQKVGWVAGL